MESQTKNADGEEARHIGFQYFLLFMRMFQVRGIRVAVGGDTRVPAAIGSHVEAARSRGIAALDGLRRGVVV